jgi:hypothetical protein
MTWILIYVMFALQRVYEQGWLLTILKYTFISIAYFVLLIMGLVGSVIAGVLLI